MESLKQKRTRAHRIRKRIAIRFETRDARSGSGFTTNLSARGLGVSTHTVLPKGTKLNVEVTLPGGDRCRVECVVAWGHQGVAQFRTPGGMGLRVTWADEQYLQFAAHVVGADASVSLSDPPQPPPATETSGRTVVEKTIAVAPPRSVAEQGDRVQPPGAAHDIDIPSGPVFGEPAFLVARAPRIAEQLPIRVGPGEELTGRGFTINLSRTGLALLTTMPLKADEQIHVAISTPDGSLSCGIGCVVWSRPQSFGTGRHIVAGVRLDCVDISYDELLDVLARA